MDLAGKMLLPAFHDSHVHPVSSGIEAAECDLHGMETADQVLAKIKGYAASHAKAAWILGGGWELPIFPNGSPTKAMLDDFRARKAGTVAEATAAGAPSSEGGY